ncbi:hypothetical protein [Stenotrophomonas maltophilia]|uniref:hypothetical protein n=1 Tax=Stenotrophomonas maltophilia TaxID=40324 RepID=UPI002FBDC3A5
MGENFSEGISRMALQQGGMGLILTTLILLRHNGGDVLPGNIGQLHGMFADRR